MKAIAPRAVCSPRFPRAEISHVSLVDPDYRFRKTEIAWCRDAGFELTGSHGSTFFYVLTFQLAEEAIS